MPDAKARLIRNDAGDMALGKHPYVHFHQGDQYTMRFRDYTLYFGFMGDCGDEPPLETFHASRDVQPDSALTQHWPKDVWSREAASWLSGPSLKTLFVEALPHFRVLLRKSEPNHEGFTVAIEPKLFMSDDELKDAKLQEDREYLELMISNSRTLLEYLLDPQHPLRSLALGPDVYADMSPEGESADIAGLLGGAVTAHDVQDRLFAPYLSGGETLPPEDLYHDVHFQWLAPLLAGRAKAE